MAKAVGKRGGRYTMIVRSRGAQKPTAPPHRPPQAKPQSSTGMCMRQSAFPSAISFPVRNGSSIHIAREIPENVRFLMLLFFI